MSDMGAREVTELEELANEGSLVDLDMANDPILTGAILAVGPESLLIQRFDDECMTFTGWSIVMTKVLNRYRPESSFVSTFVEKKGLRPKSPRRIDLASIRGTLEWLHAEWPLIMVHRSVRFPGELQVGSLAAFSDKTLTLKRIDTDAEWDDTYRIRLEDVTRIDFGGHYERALLEVASRDL